MIPPRRKGEVEGTVVVVTGHGIEEVLGIPAAVDDPR